jgi:hypothetical protein
MRPAIRFTRKGRFDEFQKGETGIITKVLAEFPYATETIYLVQTNRGKQVWCTAQEVEPWNQTSLLPS